MKGSHLKLNDHEKLILAYRKDPVWACREIFGIRLNWYQRHSMRCLWKYPFLIELWGRGCSKTSLTTYYLVLKAMLYPKTKIGCIAPSFRQACYIFDEMKNEIEPNSAYFRASVDKKGISMGTMRAIVRFKNGSFIEALPIKDGSTIRGRRYNIVFVDEYMEVPENIVTRVVQPFLNVIRKNQRNQMVIAFTATYKWNHCWPRYVLYRAKEGSWPKEVMERLELSGFKVEKEKYKVLEFDFRDVDLEEDPPFQISEENIENTFISSTHEDFAMENLNLFPDENIGFFPSKLVLDKAVRIEEEFQQMKAADSSDSFFAFGIDVARSDKPEAANFCIQVIRIKGNLKNLCKTITLHGATYQKMLQTIRKEHLNFGLDRVVRIDMDQGGGGTTIRDLLTEPWKDLNTGFLHDPILEFEDEKFVGIQTRYKNLFLQNQTDVFNNHIFHSLKADLEQGRLILPVAVRKSTDREEEEIGINIHQTKTELIMLEPTAVRAGLKFDVPKGYQKDRAVALALANYGANMFLGSEFMHQKKKELPVGFWV